VGCNLAKGKISVEKKVVKLRPGLEGKPTREGTGSKFLVYYPGGG